MNNFVNKKHNHIEQLSPELLIAYRKGELSPEKENLVERLLLENPFYEEGLEGMESLDLADLERDLAELNQRIEKRYEDKKKTVFWAFNWRIAASVLVICASTLVFVWLFNKNQTPHEANTVFEPKDSTFTIEPIQPRANELQYIAGNALEVEKVPALKLNDFTADLLTQSSEVEELTQRDSQAKEKIEIDKIQVDKSALQKEISQAFQSQQEEERKRIAKEESIAKTLQGKVSGVEISGRKQTVKGESDEKSIELKLQGASGLTDIRMNTGNTSTDSLLRMKMLPTDPAVRESAGFLTSKTIHFQVLGEDDNLPLPQVSVVKKGTSEGMPTNIDGWAQVSISGQGIIVFGFLGYTTKELNIKPDSPDTVIVKMSPDLYDLTEIIVTGYGAQTSTETSSHHTSAKPQNGMRDYKKYLETNLRYPQEAINAGIKGTVIVEFIVNSNGSLENLSIRKSLGFGCDEEALRLIKEGPKWEAAQRGNTLIKSKVRIRIRFKL